MKRINTWLAVLLLSTSALIAQESKEKMGEYDEIIIKRKGDKDAKVTVEIKDGLVRVNGKPISEFEDNDISVRKKKVVVKEGYLLTRPEAPMPPGSAFRWQDGGDGRRIDEVIELNANRAFLGVTTEKGEQGVVITEVTPGSAASKAGLKEGDILTQVDEIKIEDPEGLSAAIGKYKPEEKVTLGYRRDNKSNKMTVTLGKRSGLGSTRALGPDAPRVMEFDLRELDNMRRMGEELRMEGLELDKFGKELEEMRRIVPRGGQSPSYRFSWSDNSAPKLGIKTQDLEEGKGSKVLSVEAGSQAEKAGIKVGDVITHFDGKETVGTTELAEAVAAARGKSERISVQILRGGKSQNLSLVMPKKIRTANL